MQSALRSNALLLARSTPTQGRACARMTQKLWRAWRRCAHRVKCIFEVKKSILQSHSHRARLLPGLTVQCLLLDKTFQVREVATTYSHRAKPLAKQTGQLEKAWPPCLT